jgi:hypothetical protein
VEAELRETRFSSPTSIWTSLFMMRGISRRADQTQMETMNVISLVAKLSALAARAAIVWSKISGERFDRCSR